MYMPEWKRCSVILTEIVSIEVVVCEDFDIRLMNGIDNSSGGVEICFNRLWWTLQDRKWNEEKYASARVVCRQLGLPTDG